MGKGFISYRKQSYLALIPYFGFAIVVLTSFYNIYKMKNLLYVGLYYLFILIPIAFFFSVAMMIGKYFISGKDQTIMIVMYFLLMFITLLCIAIVCLAIEKAMIRKLEK